jgi:hypothetical protein
MPRPQYIDDPLFPEVTATGDFDKRSLDPAFVHDRTALITRAWRRLREIVEQNIQSVLEYPLPEAQQKWRQ